MKNVPHELANYCNLSNPAPSMQPGPIPEIVVYHEALSAIDVPEATKQEWLRTLHFIAAAFVDEAFKSQPMVAAHPEKMTNEHRDEA